MAPNHSPRFLQIVQDAKKRIREVTVDDVKAKLDHGEKFQLVDVREESEYAKDHLPGAIHLGNQCFGGPRSSRSRSRGRPAHRGSQADAGPSVSSIRVT